MPMDFDLGEAIRQSRRVKISFDTPQGDVVIDMPQVIVNSVNISQTINHNYNGIFPTMTETELTLSVKPLTYNLEILPNGAEADLANDALLRQARETIERVTDIDCEDSDELNEFLNEFTRGDTNDAE